MPDVPPRTSSKSRIIKAGPPTTYDEGPILDVVAEYMDAPSPLSTMTRFPTLERLASPVENMDEHDLCRLAKDMGPARPPPPTGTLLPAHVQLLNDESAMFVEDVTDVFCVGADVNASRSWLEKIDARKPFYKDTFSSELFRQRAYHARMYYELALSIEIMDSDWVSRPALVMLRDSSLLELRSVELHIASFQLSNQMVGIKGEDGALLYKCAAFAWSLHVFLFDEIARLCNHKKGRKDVLALRPAVTDSKRELAVLIDSNVHACHKLTESGMPLLTHSKEPAFLYSTGKRMGLVIRALSEIVIVCEEEEEEEGKEKGKEVVE